VAAAVLSHGMHPLLIGGHVLSKVETKLATLTRGWQAALARRWQGSEH
jgi:hypothetical protein